MTEHVKQRHLFATNRVLHAWSVSFPDGVSPAGVRGDLARNMVAQVAQGNVAVRNDFDRLSIYQRPVFNATWDSATCRWVDLVRQGEEGFTFTPIEENREVVYRCQPFWYKIDFSGENGPSFISVTDRPLEGYKLAPMFRSGTAYEYRPCFELALGEDGKPHSRAGLMPLECAPVDMMAQVRSYDSSARTEKMADWFSDYLLLLVEFATRDLHTLMPGMMDSSLTLTVCKSLSTGPKLGLYVNSQDLLTVGEELRIVYKATSGEEYWCDVTVMEIGTEETSLGYYLTTDLADVESWALTYEGFEFYYRPARTGAVLPYLTNASSGTYGDGVSNPCVWRGKENPWGNVSSLICDVLLEVINSTQAEFCHLSDIDRFDGTRNDAYTALRTVDKTNIGTGYIKRFMCAGEDYLMIPDGCGFATFTQYWATYTKFTPAFMKLGVRFLRVGGDYRLFKAVNHGTYEFYGEANIKRFGARLVLKEGG